MLCACGAQGVTTLVGAAREPEIVDLERFLNKLGARVSGAGTPVVTIEGGHPLHGAEHTVMGDRIVASTWLCACGAAGGEIALTGVEPSSLDTVLSCLEQAGENWGAGERRSTSGARNPCGASHRYIPHLIPAFPPTPRPF